MDGWPPRAFSLEFGAIIWYASHIEPDQWSIFRGSLRVLLTIGLGLAFGWVAYDGPGGRTAFWRIVFGRGPGMRSEKKLGGDGYGLE